MMSPFTAGWLFEPRLMIGPECHNLLISCRNDRKNSCSENSLRTCAMLMTLHIYILCINSPSRFSLSLLLAAGQKKKTSSHLLASTPPAKICAASILFIPYSSSHMALVLDLNGFRHVDVAALQSPRGRAAEQRERIRFLLWKKGPR